MPGRIVKRPKKKDERNYATRQEASDAQAAQFQADIDSGFVAVPKKKLFVAKLKRRRGR